MKIPCVSDPTVDSDGLDECETVETDHHQHTRPLNADGSLKSSAERRKLRDNCPKNKLSMNFPGKKIGEYKTLL